MIKLSRDEALEWLVDSVTEWPYDELPQAFDDAWSWGGLIGSIKLYSLHRNEVSITKQDWLEAKKSKEKAMNNKELMMKAAIKFKGVWPDNEYCEVDDQRIGLCLDSYREDGRAYEESGLYPVGCDAISPLWSIVCTREQFESFVESLFDDSPEGTTHYLAPMGRTYPCWIKDLCTDNDFCRYKVIIEEVMHSYTDENWQGYNANKVLEGGVLIPRPTKKAPVIGDTPQQLKEGVQPQAPYMPKVGEECEVSVDDGMRWYRFVKTDKRDLILDGYWGEISEDLYPEFRQLRTEHEKLTDALVNIMINHYGNPKGAEGYKQLAEAILNDESLSVISVSNQV